MKFLSLLLDLMLGLALLSVISSPEEIPEPILHAITPPILHALLLAYDPYDECVGPGPYIFPRKTPGGGDAEKMGLGADPQIFPYGTRIKFHDPDICKFIHETDPADKDGAACILTVDDTGSAAVDDTVRGINHLEIRAPRRAPNEDAHARALSLGRHENTEIEIVSSPRSR